MKKALLLVVLLAGCGKSPSAVGPSCLRFNGNKPTPGSIYYEYKGVKINLPNGKSCIMPDGSTFGAG